ncbi:endo-1,4-beta-xylanase [Mucilaginibacter sp. UR6-11]|uniref:endo-1,4-beta-xylanase n=1 Tax=Mucilaginibacter sp. UR6-11 TaxID=1435644 RepID=UPI001E346C69|nr:endo-1,4-beta-xylanase [Mucilaginibacter sp. UR6-11]MCC8426933.1 endo-1,4-beta-xylanase [Mucilaginibacter sp. UR6-11]
MLKLILNRALLLLPGLFWVIGANGQAAGNKGLKDYYAGYFPVGVAVTPALLRDPAAQALILQHFNSLTPENAMKMGPIHPEENRYYWNDADAIVDFAQQHGLKVRGHNLCWHQQTPAWMYRDKDGGLVTKEVLLERLKQHIYAVVGRYKGKIYAWDVVNEAVADENDKVYRNSVWYQLCGDDYILKAFQYAHEADPDAILFYNEYGTENPQKRDRVYRLLKKLIDAGAPVNAIGLQAHWNLTDPTNAQITDAIKLYASLGLKVQITELDMNIYGHNDKEAMAYTPEIEQKQTERYGQVFKLFRENKQYITGVTFWNLSDRSSWLDNFPVKGRKNYPLLFDQDLQPKKAYQSVVTF